MGRLHEEISVLMAAQLLARQRWNELPMIYRIHLKDGKPYLHPFALNVWETHPDMDPVDVLEIIGHMMESFHTLTGFRPGADDPEGELHGIAFRHEGQARDFAVPMPGTRGPRPVPGDWVQIRLMIAVDRAGITYQVMQQDGADHAERSIAYPNDDNVMTGSVVLALDRMVRALTGFASPDRMPPYMPAGGNLN